MKKIKKIIPVTGPSITKLEVRFVNEAVKNGWFENSNKYIKWFEKEFAEYIGVKYAIATSSCSGALHLALLGLGVKKGDEVIVPDITWAASAAAIKYVGAKPVFVDIDPYTWCLDPSKIERVITERTKAIMPVTIYGHPPAMNEIIDIAQKHQLYIIEDAAQSIGSKYYDKRPGSFGDAAGFSFHGTKIMTTGEGGMFVTNNKELFLKVDSLSNEGKDPNKLFWILRIGYKYKMTNLQAALGLAQLKRIDELVTKKRQIFNWYKQRLQNIDGITLNAQMPHCYNTYWMPTVIINKRYGIKKERLMKKLKEYNIISRPFFYPLSSMPPFKIKVNNPIAYNLSPYGINLPSGQNLNEQKVDYICNCLFKILKVK
ncbi:DegT/DnrJ/EryC1/StrS family aminotransferase [Patescibacteria group bacterium]|nr:DegT/DnrJ/EryC1/StrS family aminotransferase [Patescibacteria group bacterium]